MTHKVLILFICCSFFSAKSEKRNFNKFLFVGVSGGFNENIQLDDFHTDLKESLKDIADTINPSNRAFVEESTSGTFVNFTLGARVIQTSKVYLEADFSYLLATTKSANSQITGSSALNKLIEINHQFKEQHFVAHMKVFKPLSSRFHIGASVGIGYGKAKLTVEGDSTALGGTITSNDFEGDGFVAEYAGHLKYAPSRFDNISLILNVGFRNFRPKDLKNVIDDQIVNNRFGDPIDFHFFSLYTSIEARFQF